MDAVTKNPSGALPLRSFMVGDAFPRVTLESQDGVLLTVPSDFPGKALVVTFIRGHWCPYCRRYLTKLNDRFDEFVKRDTRLVVISPEQRGTTLAMATELKLKMPVLTDDGGAVIDELGIRNRGAGLQCLLPHPSLYILNRFGAIRFRSVDRNYKKRTTIRTILGELDAINP